MANITHTLIGIGLAQRLGRGTTTIRPWRPIFQIWMWPAWQVVLLLFLWRRPFTHSFPGGLLLAFAARGQGASQKVELRAA